MACFARNSCVFGGIGTFTTCGCGMNFCSMNNNPCCCNQNSNRCNAQQTRCEAARGRENDCGCDDNRSQNGCDRRD